LVKKEVTFLKALADDTRFRIVLFLSCGRKSVSDITKQVKKAQPTVSLQLKLLALSGVITSEKEGRKVFYKIKDKRIAKLMKALEEK